MNEKDGAPLGATGGGKAKFKGFANYHLSAADKESIGLLEMTPEHVVEFLQEWAESGYVISVRWDEKSDSLVLNLMGFYKGCRDAGVVLAARHVGVEKMFAVAAYVNGSLMGNEAWPVGSGGEGEHDW